MEWQSQKAANQTRLVLKVLNIGPFKTASPTLQNPHIRSHNTKITGPVQHPPASTFGQLLTSISVDKLAQLVPLRHPPKSNNELSHERSFSHFSSRQCQCDAEAITVMDLFAAIILPLRETAR
jgi:hypothetical protein